MDTGTTITIIAFLIAIALIGGALFIAVKFYIEAKEDSKAMEDLLKRAKENDTLCKHVASKYFEYYHNNN